MTLAVPHEAWVSTEKLNESPSASVAERVIESLVSSSKDQAAKGAKTGGSLKPVTVIETAKGLDVICPSVTENSRLSVPLKSGSGR